MLTVAIRNKNQKESLSFLLNNLKNRYNQDISEILIIDNESTDGSVELAISFGVRVVNIKNFSYGSSANLAASESSNDIIVIFSAHSYPVSHDFFKLIKDKFKENFNLAGLRCLHSPNDYRNFINNICARQDPNKSGLIFSGSAFNRKVWQLHPFRNDVSTFEDKEWSKRVIELGYDIDFVPSIFSYEISRTKKQSLFRFKNDIIGNYQLWHSSFSFFFVLRCFFGDIYNLTINFFTDILYVFKRSWFRTKFLLNKPSKF